MGRIINPQDIQTQANSVIVTQDIDKEKLLDALIETSAFPQTAELQGEAWNGVKAQMAAHDTVIQGLVGMIDAMSDASKKLISLSGDEHLDEDKLIDQLNTLKDRRISYENSINSYKENLQNDIYEFFLGWYARGMISHYESAIVTTDEQITSVEAKLTEIDNIDNSTRNLTDEVSTVRDAASQGIRYLESTWTGGGFDTSSLENMPWASTLGKAWNDYLKKDNEAIKEFLDSLPEELKPYVDASDVEVTDDGFVMLTKPLSEILTEIGVTDTNLTEGVNDVENYYDDWYIYAIKGDDGQYTYSLLKMREQESDGFDGDDPSVSISFVEFDINVLANMVGENGQTEENINALDAEIEKVTSSSDSSYDEVLQEYFADSTSDAPYLVANQYIEKIASTNVDNKIVLPNLLTENENRVIDALNALNEKAGRPIYDPENNCINIQDPSSLTEEERYAILAAYTGDVTYNSFAAEVEFHSDALLDWKSIVPGWYNSALRADMGIGETNKYGWAGNFDEYYDLDSDMVQSQRDAHGDK